MDEIQKKYWFPAKRYGWGWGPPATWQGWLVMLIWFAILVAVSPWLVLRSWPLFFLFIIAMTAIVIAIGYLKGEPPRWRWGDK